VKRQSLQDLKGVYRALTAQQAAEREAQRERERQRQQQLANQAVFARAVGPVKAIHAAERAALTPLSPPAPIARQQQRDEQAVLLESLSDDFDVSTLLDTDADLSYAQTGIGPDVVRRLRQGHWSLQGEIDLHGLRIDEARVALTEFVQAAQRRGWRCVRVVHGKGLGSPGKTPVLKQRVLRWLVQKHSVLAFVQAPAPQGGAGALLVLLKGQ
jgi:DNA-nicking Smr family endonuclease